MYLTRMFLNPQRRGTRYLLSSPQRMHAAVLAGFPPTATLATGRVLWRLDRGERHELTLWISSPGRPDLTSLVEQAGWAFQDEPWQTADLERLLTRLQAGQRWVFRLTANPVIARSRDGGRSRLVGLALRDQERWLASRSSQWGFEVAGEAERREDSANGQLAVSNRRNVQFRRGHGGKGHRVTLSIATYDGTLTVTDPARLREAMINGIGRAKGYGCGLLTLAPTTPPASDA